MIDDDEVGFIPVVPLSRQIGDIAQVEAMDDDELERMQALHEAEILKLDNRIKFGERAGAGCEVALRVLRLHKHWVTREIKRRVDADKAARAEENAAREDAARAARKAAQQAFAQQQERAHAARLERVRESNDENLRQMVIFKRLVRETVGDEVYLRLWEAVNAELQQQPKESVL